jgi:soluble lytic murein transglycosylase-like protein
LQNNLHWPLEFLRFISRLGMTAILCIATEASAHNVLCFKEAAHRYGLNEMLLVAIAKTESNLDSKAIHINKNGTKDIGLMQINSSHLGTLGRYGITEQRLLDEPCTNIYVGAWVLATNIAIHGKTWKAVGSYNTGPYGAAANQEIYIARVSRNLKLLK